MNYKEYIQLGFERTDLEDSVEFDEVGYHGFALSKRVSKNKSIHVNSGELNNPKLFLRQKNDTFVIIEINGQIVKDLINNDKVPNYTYAS